MELKDKLISSYASFEKENQTNEQMLNIRKEAIKTFEDKGFPSNKDETWRYTSLRPVLRESYSLFPKTEKSLSFDEIEKYLVDDLDSYRLIFVDGIYSEENSQLTDGKFEISTLSAALENEKYNAIFEKHYNNIRPKDDSLSALNTAFSKEGTFVHIKKGQVLDKPLQILYLSTGSEPAMMLQPRNLVVIEENAQAKIIERHMSINDNPVFTNSVTEIFAGKYALLDYYKIQKDKDTATLIDNTFVDQRDNSNISIQTFALGGKLLRNQWKATQNGEHLDTTFKGVTLLNGKQQADHITLVHHAQPNNESHQDFKGMFDDRSKGVFDGYILVDRTAQKTNGYQKSDNILLSDRAVAHAKPQLEIYADDVLCSHGCTIGQMDENALRYLRTRGIPEKEAKALMMYAFCSSVLSSVTIPELQKNADKWIAHKLGVDMGFHD